MEAFISGHWAPLHAPAGVSHAIIIVCCGNALERAANGLFCAAQPQARNDGRLHTRAMKLRLDPPLVTPTSSIFISANAEPPLLEELQLSTALCCRELKAPAREAGTSESASRPPPLPLLSIEEDLFRGAVVLGTFDALRSVLALFVLNWLRNVSDLCSLSLVCRSLQRAANSGALHAAAAESSCIDWGAAFDRVN